MSIHQNSNRGSANSTLKIIGIVVFVLILIKVINSPNRQRPASPSVLTNPASSVTINPLLDMLNESSGQIRALQEGIAIGVAVDVSGSMDEGVKDKDGLTKSKIEIARKCVLGILKQADSFAREHVDKKIEVGIFEFSSLSNRLSCRQVIPFGPTQSTAVQAIGRMHPEGGTPIGDAMITIKQEMNATGLSHQHLLVITDGENNQGYDPGDVVNALSRMSNEKRSSVYFFAFDVSVDKFKHVRDSGGLVMAASNGQELEQTLDYVLTGKILVEQPEVGGKK